MRNPHLSAWASPHYGGTDGSDRSIVSLGLCLSSLQWTEAMLWETGFDSRPKLFCLNNLGVSYWGHFLLWAWKPSVHFWIAQCRTVFDMGIRELGLALCVDPSPYCYHRVGRTPWNPAGCFFEFSLLYMLYRAVPLMYWEALIAKLVS